MCSLHSPHRTSISSDADYTSGRKGCLRASFGPVATCTCEGAARHKRLMMRSWEQLHSSLALAIADTRTSAWQAACLSHTPLLAGKLSGGRRAVPPRLSRRTSGATRSSAAVICAL